MDCIILAKPTSSQTSFSQMVRDWTVQADNRSGGVFGSLLRPARPLALSSTSLGFAVDSTLVYNPLSTVVGHLRRNPSTSDRPGQVLIVIGSQQSNRKSPRRSLRMTSSGLHPTRVYILSWCLCMIVLKILTNLDWQADQPRGSISPHHKK